VNFSLCDAYYVEILFAANKMSYKITLEVFFVVKATDDPHGVVHNYYDCLFFKQSCYVLLILAASPVTGGPYGTIAKSSAGHR
jgi:hypothetical protein